MIADASANIRFLYRIPLTVSQILFYDSLILLAGVWAITMLKKAGQQERKE